MGTNFYWLGESYSLEGHVGKRSAAGLYCYDCRMPLVEGGAAFVHDSDARCLDACPSCGKRKQDGGYNAAMIELGFEQQPEPPIKPMGVQGASSFSWGLPPDIVTARCNASLFEPIIENEYGDTLTGVEFLRMIDAFCPVQFTDSIGRDFS